MLHGQGSGNSNNFAHAARSGDVGPSSVGLARLTLQQGPGEEVLSMRSLHLRRHRPARSPATYLDVELSTTMLIVLLTCVIAAMCEMLLRGPGTPVGANGYDSTISASVSFCRRIAETLSYQSNRLTNQPQLSQNLQINQKES